MERVGKSERLHVAANSLSQMNYIYDFSISEITSLWTDTFLGSFAENKVYVVQTSQKTIQRCILMTTDPGDLVSRPHLRLRHYGLCRRAVGASLDHHRHLPRGASSGSRSYHGRPLSLLSAGGQPGGTNHGSRTRGRCGSWHNRDL